jgi:hypothetical protein
MTKHRIVGLSVWLALGTLATPLLAQDFMVSTRAIPEGDFRLTADPVGLFGRNGNPDRWGALGRLGYGITDNFGIEGTAALFDGFSTVGADTAFWLRRDNLDLSFSLGAHEALVRGASDSTAFDASWAVGARLSRRLRVQGGIAASLESLNDVPHSSFSRLYLVPGLDLRLTRRVAFVSELGVGLNSDSPSYLTAGFSFYLPVSDRDDWR